MEISDKKPIYTRDRDEVGHVDRVVIEPRSRRISHLVVRRGALLPEDRVMPIDWVEDAGGGELRLTAAAGDLDSLPPFEETHYVPLPEEDIAGWQAAPVQAAPMYWYPPFTAVPPAPYFLYPREVERNIPEGSLTVSEGATVLTSDGEEVGEIERILADPDSGRLTHLVISDGALAAHRKLIPALWLSRAGDDEVHLAVSSRMFAHLPPFEEND
jgi:sporulation protein YlmC with PRC-barrel domain